MRDLSKVMMIEFTKNYGSCNENLLAIYNADKINEDNARKFILSGERYHPDIIMITKRQWDSVFGG